MILVTGATGYTGPFVVEALIQGGERIRALARRTSDTAAVRKAGSGVGHDLMGATGGVEVVVGDLEDERSLLDALEGVEAVVGVSHIRHAPALVRACAARGVTRGVFFSSTRLTSKVPSPTVREVIDGEAAVAGSRLDFTLLRPTMIYGPGDDRNVSRIRRHIRTHRVIPVFGSGERLQQPVFVRDVAQAVSRVLCRAATTRRAYVLAGPKPISYIGVIDAVAAAERRWVVKVYLPLRMSAWAAGIYERTSSAPRITAEQVRRFGEDKVFDNSDARRDFGYDPVPFEEGLRLSNADLTPVPSPTGRGEIV